VSRHPDLTLRSTNQGTRIVRTIATNASGNFVFVSVPPGTYVIGAELSGFKSAQTVPFVVAVGETVNRSLSLAVGALSEAVTVAAQSPLLQVASSELGTVIPEQAVHDLPLNGRNFTQLMTHGAIRWSDARGVGRFQDAGITGIRPSFRAGAPRTENRSTLCRTVPSTPISAGPVMVSADRPI
jgi:hypothetical protein